MGVAGIVTSQTSTLHVQYEPPWNDAAVTLCDVSGGVTMGAAWCTSRCRACRACRAEQELDDLRPGEKGGLQLLRSTSLLAGWRSAAYYGAPEQRACTQTA